MLALTQHGSGKIRLRAELDVRLAAKVTGTCQVDKHAPFR